MANDMDERQGKVGDGCPSFDGYSAAVGVPILEQEKQQASTVGKLKID